MGDKTKENWEPVLVIAMVGTVAFLLSATLSFSIPARSELSERFFVPCELLYIVEVGAFVLTMMVWLRIVRKSSNGSIFVPQIGRIESLNGKMGKGVSGVVAVVLLACAVVALMYAQTRLYGDAAYAALVVASKLLEGVVVAILSLKWGGFYTKAFFHLSRKTVYTAICLSIVLAGVFLLCSYVLSNPAMAEAQMAVAMFGSSLLSVFLCVYCNERLDPIEESDVAESSRMWAKRMSGIMSLLRPAYMGFCLAVCLWMLPYLNDGYPMLNACGFGLSLVVAGCAYCAAIRLRKSAMSVPTVDKISCSICCVGFSILSVTDDIVFEFVLVVILCACFFFFVQTWCTIFQMMSYWPYDPRQTSSQYSLSTIIGLLVGFSALFLGEHFAGLPLETVIGLASIVVVVMYVLCCVFVPYDNPVWRDFSNLVNGIDNIAIDEGVEKVQKIGQFKKRCLELAEAHGLTPRETEVLLMLAKGRNAAIIARELVISPYTARTHIYRIFKKFNVQTQQELIDRIEKDEEKDGIRNTGGGRAEQKAGMGS